MIRFLLSLLFALAIGATTAHAEVTAFAAASLTNALDDVNTAFTKQSGFKVVVSYVASSALIKQIEQGAPADVFDSADLRSMEYGVQKKIIKDDIIYPAAATVNAKPETIQYLSFLRSAVARAIFERYGFTVLAKPTS